MIRTLCLIGLLCFLVTFSCTACTARDGSGLSRAAVTMKIDLHSQPGFDSQTTCTLLPGDRVVLLDSLNQNGTLWYLVQASDSTSSRGRRGWILADALVALDTPLKCFSCGV
ncbi:MAG: SH3 domain-containing protein [Actinobacteria bacterium]|nr:SH3 domain-containing protein [Actinomycetota bacterium]